MSLSLRAVLFKAKIGLFGPYLGDSVTLYHRHVGFMILALNLDFLPQVVLESCLEWSLLFFNFEIVVLLKPIEVWIMVAQLL